MKYHAITVLIYAAIVILGGVFGYVKANSIPSLVAGVAFGIALGISGYYMLYGKNIAFYAAIGLTAFLGLFFAYRFFLAYQFMPAGLMCLLSVIVLIKLLCCQKIG